MSSTPWYTSTTLINAVKRKISFPLSSVTFTEDDILAFANEEMMISQVPSVLLYHQEFFVTYQDIPLLSNVSRYPIPNRAIGMKLRDLFWVDASGNLFEMTRIGADDKAFFSRNIGANTAIHKFYAEGNDVVLTPEVVSSPTGFLRMYYFLRPNQLVTQDRSCTISSFSNTITVDNTNITSGDTITVTDPNTNIVYNFPDSSSTPAEIAVEFTATSGSPVDNEFLIGSTSSETAVNLAAIINTDGTFSAAVSASEPTQVIVTFTNPATTITTVVTTDDGFVIPDTLTVNFDATVPEVFTAGSLVDFLQTDGGHKTRAFDVQIPAGGVGGTSMVFDASDVPSDLIVGDYVCLANECIIPQIPSDLHNGLAERTCARILAAIGDQAGLQAAQTKIQEINQYQGSLIDNRVDGAPQKITARHSILRFQKTGVRRRL